VAISNAPFVCSDDKDKEKEKIILDFEYVVSSSPDQFVGIEFLWDLVYLIQSKKVNEQVMELLTKIHIVNI
jgi:hypothetical protein